MIFTLYHLDVCVVEHHLWDFGCLAACVRMRVFLCRVLCVPALSVDPETRRLMYVAGGSSKANAESSQELQRRQERERQVDGFRVDSDSEALPKSALHNLVSKRR